MQLSRFFLLVALLSGIGLSAQTTKDSCVLEGFIEGFPAGKLRLIGTYGDQNYLADSAVIDATGHFAVRRKKTLPAGFYYFLTPTGKNFSFLIDRNEQFVIFRANAADIQNTMQVEGSLCSQLLYDNFRYQSRQDIEFKQIGEQMNKSVPGSAEYLAAKKRQDALLAERKANLAEIAKKYPNSLFVKFKTAGQNPDVIEYKKPNGDTDTIRQVVSYRSRFWDGVDFTDERLLYTPVIHNKLKRYIKELTPQRADSLVKVSDEMVRKVLPYKPYFKFVSNWIALQHENTKTTVMDGEAVYVHIVKTFFTDELAYWDTHDNLEKLRKHVWEMEASLMGKKGPDVRANDINGVERGIYDITAPIVVVFMFSPDCEHCQKDAPEIKRISEKYKSRGVEFYGIAVNTTEKEWKDFIAKEQFTFTNVFDPTNRAIYAKYYVDITPELYILNKDRIIVAKNLHANQLEEIFERELKRVK